jgi:hypothetical protein
MTNVTYYVALAFDRGEDGALVPKEGVECPSTNAAVARTKTLALVEVGSVAFSRSGDPAIGEFEPAHVLAQFGDLPDDLSKL